MKENDDKLCIIFEHYVIDSESHLGVWGYKLPDGATWEARVLRTDTYKDISSLYVYDYWEEISCRFDSDQVFKIHDVYPTMKYYRINYDENSEAYTLSAMWFLEDEGLMLELRGYSEQPINSMPVDIFDVLLNIRVEGGIWKRKPEN